MPWNWQQPDWPEFSWDSTRLGRAEQAFLVESGVAEGTFRHLAGSDRERITVESITAEALTTSEIEGEILDRASVQSSVRKQLGLPSDSRRARPAERGIARMMVDLHRSFDEPLSTDMLFRWHRKLFDGRQSLAEVGCYRTSPEAMQIVSGAVHRPKVHFEAPPAAAVPGQMKRFIGWFNRTAPDGPNALPALARAGIAHLYFESIHPFLDGNGRLGRAISEKALAQCLGRPTLTALAATIRLRRKQYYAALGAASRTNQITAWLAWFAGIAIEAQRNSIVRIEFLVNATKLLARLRRRLNDRQEKALLRMLREGPKGFSGGMSAGNYMTITDAAPATATRDLADLVSKGALRRTGQRRYARYHLTIPLGQLGAVRIRSNGEVEQALLRQEGSRPAR